MLLSLVYVSRASSPMTESGLVSLRDQSGEHNSSASITGLLLHRNGMFLQDLEGPEEDVLALYARIYLDPRHTDVRLVWTQPRVRRRFPRWSMGLLQVGSTAIEAVGPGDEPLPVEVAEAAFVSELLDLFDARE